MLFVDGHNLTFGDDDARVMLVEGDPEGARRRVLRFVELYARSTKDKALVVFDGTGGDAPIRGHGRVRYCFSGADCSADVEILRRIRGSTGRREVRLVTNDRSLAVSARKLGAQVIGLRRFLEDAARFEKKRDVNLAPEPAAKRRGPPRAEVEYWLTVFSDDDVRAAEEERHPAPKKRKK